VSENPTRFASFGADPAAASSPSEGGEETTAPWYRRRGVLVGLGVAVVLAVAVITDLPSPASRATNIASAAAVIKQVNADIAPCAYSVSEAFTIYGDLTANSLTADNRARVPTLLGDDQAACSLTNQYIFALSDIEIPGSASGRQLADVVSTVTLWATADALGAIDAIEALSTHPGDVRALAALARYEQLLASDRAAADASMRSIDAMLDARIVSLNLPEVPGTTTAS